MSLLLLLQRQLQFQLSLLSNSELTDIFLIGSPHPRTAFLPCTLVLVSDGVIVENVLCF